MIYAVYGFVFGLLIPYISRRFAKFMPATMAYALVSLCKFSKKVTSEKWEKSLTYTKLRREFFYRSLLCGIVTAAVSYFAYAHFGSRGLWWQLYFIWSLLLLAEIDYRMFLLPDILTVPLLILVALIQVTSRNKPDVTKIIVSHLVSIIIANIYHIVVNIKSIPVCNKQGYS